MQQIDVSFATQVVLKSMTRHPGCTESNESNENDESNESNENDEGNESDGSNGSNGSPQKT